MLWRSGQSSFLNRVFFLLLLLLNVGKACFWMEIQTRLKAHHLENSDSVLSCPHWFFQAIWIFLAMKIHKLYGKEKLEMRSRAIARGLKRINSTPLVQIRSTPQESLDHLMSEQRRYGKHWSAVATQVLAATPQGHMHRSAVSTWCLGASCRLGASRVTLEMHLASMFLTLFICKTGILMASPLAGLLY